MTPLKKRRRYLRQYRWSSYPAYLGLVAGHAALVCDDVKEMFSRGGDWRRAYARFVEEGLMDDVENPFDQVKGQAVLGTETFVERVRRLVRRLGVREKAAQGSVRKVRARSVADILAAVAREYAVGVAALERVRSGDAEASQAALWALAEHGRGMLTLREIGGAMGSISASAVAQVRQRHQAAMRRSRRIRRRSRRIANFIVNS